MKKKKVLIHSIAFNPDGVSTAYLYGDIALSLKKRGYDVTVLTTTPNYNVVEEQIRKQPLKWKIWGFLKKSNFNGIPVYHVPQKKFKSTILRLFGFMYWHLVSFFAGLFIKKVDVILSPSPPLSIGVVNAWLGKLKGAKVIYNVQEVYPDILGKKSGLIYNSVSKMEHYVYDKSDAVTTIDQVFHDTIKDRFKEPKKLHIIPNFVDTSIYHPLEKSAELDPKLFQRNENLKLLYAGNIGKAQDWDTLIALATMTKDKPYDFYVIGEGAMRDYLKEEIEKRNLSNIHLLQYQPRELMPEIIAFSDIQFIFMEPEIAAQGFPSKVYTIMACGKPLLVCSPKNTPIINFLSNIGCAKLITESNVDGKAKEICRWLDGINRTQLKEMGKKGLDVIEKGYSKDIVTGKYADLIDSLVGKCP
ncbi:MAG: glycosyltransferase family 4 protein [Muribaculaceae bacterium]|nr:glycosyltransferase family 4 protein [Muribaculaceae bacterium]